MSHFLPASLETLIHASLGSPDGLSQSGGELLSGLAKLALDGQLRIAHPIRHGGYERIIDAPFHTWPEIFVQLTGRGRFICNDQTLYTRPGEVMLIPPGTPHHERLTSDEVARPNPGRQLVLMCQERRVNVIIAEGDNRGKPQGLAFISLTEPSLAQQAQQLSESLSHSSPWLSVNHNQQLHSALLAHLVNAIADCLLAANSDDRLRPSQPESTLVRRCHDIVTSSLSDHHLSVSLIAQRLGMSADYCSHRYASDSGETLSRYINRTRCRHAAHLLCQSDLKISAIAWACGYADAGYFARVFHTIYGIRPRAYRHQHQPQSAGSMGRTN